MWISELRSLGLILDRMDDEMKSSGSRRKLQVIAGYCQDFQR